MRSGSSRFTFVLAVLAIAAGLLAACVPVPPQERGVGQPVATAALQAAADSALTATPSPTLAAPTASEPTASATATPAPSHTPALKSAAAAPLKTATRTPTRVVQKAPTRAATATATVDRHRIVFTENDIAQAIAAGAGAQQGVNMRNLKVRFTDGKIHVTADQVGYGLIQLRNLDMVGRLVANNGALGLEVESISPRGLAANMIPSVANQVLAQYAAQWYVEEVKTLDGRVELRIR
jgi:hypothetical protein